MCVIFKLSKLVYKGCDDPGAYLSEKEANCPHSDVKPMTYDDVKDMLEKQTNYEIPRPEPHHWHARTWEEHVTVVLKQAKIDDICSVEIPKFQAMNIHDMLLSMSGVAIKGICSLDDIVYAERMLSVKFADDYKECLCGFGRIDIYRTPICGIYGDMCVIESTMDCRRMIHSLPEKYYAICSIVSERVCDVAYFQDTKGYVYGLGKDGVFEPAYRSLKNLFIGLWHMSMEGYL